MHPDPATLNALLKRLGLSSVQRVLPEMVVLAEQQGWSYGAFLERLLAEAVARRTDSRIAQLLSRAKFPFAATIETFDFTFRSDLKRQMLGRFLGPELVNDNRSLILQGPPGTGKTHLAISIAYKAKRSRTALLLALRLRRHCSMICELLVTPTRPSRATWLPMS